MKLDPGGRLGRDPMLPKEWLKEMKRSWHDDLETDPTIITNCITIVDALCPYLRHINRADCVSIGEAKKWGDQIERYAMLMAAERTNGGLLAALVHDTVLCQIEFSILSNRR